MQTDRPGPSRLGVAVVSACLLLPAAFFLKRPGSSPLPLPAVEEPLEPVTFTPTPPTARLVSGRLSAGSTLQDLLLAEGLSPVDIHQLLESTRQTYNLGRVRAGNEYRFEMDPEGALQSFWYQIDDDEYMLANWDGTSFDAARQPFQFELHTERVTTRIEDSLWSSLLGMGEKDSLVMDLAWILQWDVDFTSVHQGDILNLVVDKKYRDGKLISYGPIRAVQFTTGGKEFSAFRFQIPGTETVHYYDSDGKSVKKAFLKVPFRFSPRITSGFSYSRFHPILKKRRPHLGVDFAAPTGTPVLASASGTITWAGTKGGFGKFVQIKHPNGFRTGYGHLSRILVSAGQRVGQGDVIGRVGSTGLATGPHLDYRVQDARGRYINPRNKIAWPSEKPLERRYWSDFAALRDGLLLQLGQRPPDPEAGALASLAD